KHCAPSMLVDPPVPGGCWAASAVAVAPDDVASAPLTAGALAAGFAAAAGEAGSAPLSHPRWANKPHTSMKRLRHGSGRGARRTTRTAFVVNLSCHRAQGGRGSTDRWRMAAGVERIGRIRWHLFPPKAARS